MNKHIFPFIKYTAPLLCLSLLMLYLDVILNEAREKFDEIISSGVIDRNYSFDEIFNTSRITVILFAVILVMICCIYFLMLNDNKANK